MAVLLICLKIFLVRIIDVSLGTIRTIFIVKEKKLIASIIGFAEVLIWFLIVKEAITLDESSIYIAIAYASGFAAGTYIGSFISQKLITGKVMVLVFTTIIDDTLIDEIRNNGFGLTVLFYKGINGSKDGRMLNISVDKSKEKKLKDLIKKFDDDAFIVVNESKYVENGYFK